MRNILINLTKAKAEIRNPPLPAIENVEDSHEEVSDNLQGQGLKNIMPSNIIDIYTRSEILLGLKKSVHTETFTEASVLFDELYKRGEIQNEQEYRNALNKISIQ